MRRKRGGEVAVEVEVARVGRGPPQVEAVNIMYRSLPLNNLQAIAPKASMKSG